MPDTPGDDLTLSSHQTGWLLSRLRRLRPQPDRAKLGGALIRAITDDTREDRMSLNEIAEAARIPRSTVHRWATTGNEEPQ